MSLETSREHQQKPYNFKSMATHSVHQKSSGDRPIRTKGNRPPPPLSPGNLISALPDAVIHHIFSFLSLKDVVKTSVLSKRWRCTWTSTTHLAFNGVRPRNHDASSFDFPSLVDSVLRQCTSPTVKKFHITDLQYHEADRPKVDRWLHFAAGRRVEDLCLSLITEMRSMYILPPSLYCWSWLVRLEVSLCRFSWDLTVSWPCLKVLSMEYAELSDDFLRRILRGSPVLESLELRQCWRIKNIIIDSTSVKDLLLIGADNFLLEKIWAPHLLSLRVSGMWKRRIFTLDDVSSLVKADLVFSIRTFSPGDKSMCYDVMKELFEKVHRVPIITIGGWCLKVLSLFEMKGVPSPLSKCQNLTLHTPITQRDLPGIAYMLGSSEFLEKLTIHLNGLHVFKYMLDKEWKDHFNYDEEDFLYSRKGNFQCLEKHLKSIEIIGFKANGFGSKRLHTLIKFLLGDTLVLEKMIIKADLHSRKGQKNHQAVVLSKLFGVSRNVLSYQRASKNAEVIFDYPF